VGRARERKAGAGGLRWMADTVEREKEKVTALPAGRESAVMRMGGTGGSMSCDTLTMPSRGLIIDV
jgi:hypothetical protein